MNTTATPTAVVALSAQPFPGGQGDAVRALPAEWRARAEELSVHDAIGLTHQLKLKDCADELEAALASMPSSSAMGVTEAMVHAFEDAYCKNWEAQRHAPEGTKELGTFFATRAGLESALAARQPLAGLSWADYWMERGQPDVAHDFDAFSRAEAWALQRFPAARQPVGQLTDTEIDARLNTLYRSMVASGQHNGGMSGVAWDRAVYRMASSQLSGKSGDLAFDTLPVARQSIATCPRDGTVVLLHWGEDHVSPGWWSAPVSPVQNDDGTWPSDTGGFPWAFIDINGGSAFLNHAVDTEYGPTHWSLYATPTALAVNLGQFLPAVRMLVVSARTSGGTTGRDAHLCEALDRVEALLPPIYSQAVGK
ncbi:hypothetical protein [Stenotrophomonas sp. YIM B13575]|uniref:hypothetical protein n=1 Tax=Stenotrophomonas sp. YIM B13575 TaxID=3366314 RepID=UPI0036999617